MGGPTWNFGGASLTLATALAMPNPNGLLSQKLCHYRNQGHTLNDILMKAAQWKFYFDLNKLYLA